MSEVSHEKNRILALMVQRRRAIELLSHVSREMCLGTDYVLEIVRPANPNNIPAAVTVCLVVPTKDCGKLDYGRIARVSLVANRQYMCDIMFELITLANSDRGM